MKCAVIIANGSIIDYKKAEAYCKHKFIICADGAISHCIKMNINPDVWVGDYDSCYLSENEFCAVTENCEIISLNTEKDMTDTEFACDIAVSRGFNKVDILGAIGSRFDHSLAKIYLLKKLFDNGVDARIINENNLIYVAKRHNKITSREYKYISLIPLSDSIEGVTSTGLKYKLNDDVLEKYTSRGVSNQLVAEISDIDILHGDALVILSND